MRLITFAALCAIVGGSGGCGNDLNCGPNTHAQGGYCVVTDVVACGEGTHAEAGQCIPDQQAANCAPGTVVDPQDANKCLPDCGAGTVVDPVTHKCVDQNSVVQPNFTETAAQENNDPLSGGTPMEFTLPGEGQSVVVGGVIGAPTEDASGSLVADYDGWAFTTTGPTLLEIEGLPVSHIRFAFMLAPQDDPGTIERVGFAVEADQAKRQLWIDRAGDWVLLVSDANNINDLLHPGLGGVDAPVGADDASFNYAFKVTTLTPPAYSNLPAATPMDSTYADGPKFFSVTAAAGQVVEMWNYGSVDAVAATTIYETGTTVARSSHAPVVLYRAGVQPLRVVADYLWNWGPDQSATYEARALTPTDLGNISAPVARTGEVIAATRDSRYYSLTVNGNALVEVSAATTASSFHPVVTLSDARLEPFSARAPGFAVEYVTGTGAIEYLARVTDAQYNGGAGFTYDLAVTATAVTPAAEVEPNDTLATATAVTALPAVMTGALSADTDVDVYTVTLAADGTLVAQTLPGAAGQIDTIVTLYAADGTTALAQSDDIDLQGGNYLSRVVKTGLTAGTYVVTVEGYQAGDYGLALLAR
ncbi:MAG TPA: DVUA0089 family protein [Polyangia bacterium]|jgi:hypothetical protein